MAKIDIAHILCPIDFSEFSRRALQYSAALARWYDADVTLLHACGVPPPVLTYAELPPDVKLDTASRARLQAELERWAEEVCSDLPTTALVVDGAIVPTILEQAERLPADLIIMGTHGASGFERLVLGSVTEKVLRKTGRPVLTVPRRLSAVPPDRAVQFKTILCPLDFSPSSNRALHYALSLAQEADARLILLHVLEDVPEREDMRESIHFSVPEYARYREEDARARLRGAVPEEARNWCQPLELVARGKAYREILRVAETEGADLIVMGVLGRNPIDLALFGSTTHHVVRGASCPVLTLRAA